jgi:hypothetical protein
MKAALEAWGADSNLFHQGVAKQSDDPDVVAATMAAPGVVLRRSIGSNGPFKEHAELPTDIEGEHGAKKHGRKPGRHAPAKRPEKAKPDPTAERSAALAYEREEERRERERAKEAAARQKERERREKATAKAQASLDVAEREHAKMAADLQAEAEGSRSARGPRALGGKGRESGCKRPFGVRGNRRPARPR